MRLAEQERRRQESARIDFMDSSIMMIEFEDQFKRQPSSIFWVKKRENIEYYQFIVYMRSLAETANDHVRTRTPITNKKLHYQKE